MRSAGVVVVGVLLAGLAHAQAGRVTIAVRELKGKGLEQAAASIVSDRLRAECINTGVFRVMERAEMENVLKEQGLQQTGACDEASCLVEVGQLPGVERMVAGSLGKVGSFYTISLRMINVATGEILYTVNVDHKGSSEDVISKAAAAGGAGYYFDMPAEEAAEDHRRFRPTIARQRGVLTRTGPTMTQRGMRQRGRERGETYPFFGAGIPCCGFVISIPF